VQLAPAIKENTKLKTLDLGSNDIGPNGIKALAERGLQVGSTWCLVDEGYMHDMADIACNLCCQILRHTALFVQLASTLLVPSINI
jgi:hypothetical protein